MSSASFPAPAAALPRAAARARALPVRVELLGLLALAAVLNLWGLSINGTANEYYAAAVKSMASSWHAFLYGSFDVSGIQTVDKPPLALWIQALSVRAFGYGSLQLLVPQALMGVASVGLVYDLVRRRFGRFAGAVGGLALALTPIAVAISRHNNPDALLVLCCVLALWAIVRALEDGRARWVVLSGVAVGLGFEAKMAAALMVVPAIVAAYLWVAPRGRAVAARQLACGGAAMAAVGLAWPLLMWLTPASDRPWISGTSDNSVWSLILGYNGLGRLFGQDGGPGGAMGGPGGGGGPGGVFGGETGALRLFNSALGGQAGWLIGFALAGGIGIAVLSRLRRTDARTGWIIAVGGTALTIAVAFSRAEGIFHPYYVSQLAPFVAALVGAAAGEVVRGRRAARAAAAEDVSGRAPLAAGEASSDEVVDDGGPRSRVLGPAVIAGGVFSEMLVLRENGAFTWLPLVLCGVGAFTAVVLAMGVPKRVRLGAVAVALTALLAAPATWAAQTVGHATSGTFPAGGPATMTMGGPGGGGGGMFGGNSGVSEAVAYAQANGGGTIAVSSQSSAAGTILRGDGVDVAAIGGFSGRESEVSISWLADAVEQGRIRYVLTDGASGMPNDGRTGATTVMSAAAQVGRETSVSGLYDLQGTADALRALAG